MQRYRPFLVEKGWIAIDGVSLTVVRVAEDTFSVCLIPETLARTTLGFKNEGGQVHLEFDGTAKARLCAFVAAWCTAATDGRTPPSCCNPSTRSWCRRSSGCSRAWSSATSSSAPRPRPLPRPRHLPRRRPLYSSHILKGNLTRTGNYANEAVRADLARTERKEHSASPRSVLRLGLVPNDQHGAFEVVHAVLADASQHRPAEVPSQSREHFHEKASQASQASHMHRRC